MNVMEELKSIVDVPVVMADHNGLIFYVNAKFEEVFLWSSDEIIGKHLTTIIPKELHDAHNLGFSRFLSTEKSTILNFPLELAAVKKNGVVFAAEHNIRSEKNNGFWIFCATIRPLEDPSNPISKEEGDRNVR